MDIDALVARLRELGDSPSELMQNAFHLAEALSPEQRALFVAALGLSDEQQARLKSMLDRASRIRHADDVTPNAPQRPQDEDGPRIAHGTLINGRYEIRGLLDSGGMGDVYEARDARLGRRVAIKFLRAPAGGELASRFVREARATAQCKHENIVEIHDVGEVEEPKSSPAAPAGVPFMVLEYLDGETLRRRLAGVALTERAGDAGDDETRRQRPAPAPRRSPALTPREALDIMIPVVRALVCAHRHDIVHRDLKPENIFITRSGAIKVLDFGVAKALTHASSESAGASAAALTRDDLRTHDGMWLGTIPYMSPEQWNVDKVDQRTDLWAVGVMLHELLTGACPLPATSNTELRQEVCDLARPMPRIADAKAGTGALADVIERCLRKKKSERMASASELLAALDEIRANLDPPARKPMWSRRAALMGLAILMFLSVGAFTRTRTGCREPRLEIPLPPDHTRGVVVAVANDANQAARDIHDSLCQKIGERLSRATICVELANGRIDDKALEQAAAPAATLVIRVDNEQVVRFLPVGEDVAAMALARPALAPIWTDLPGVKASRPAIQDQVAAVAIALSRVLAGDVSTEHFDIPPARLDDAGWRFAALTWGLGLIHGNENKFDPSDVKEAMQTCEPPGVADWYCAAAHYAYAASCETCGDVASVLERLAGEGATPFRDMAKVRVARVSCEQGKLVAAAQALVEVDEAWTEAGCERLALAGPAMCVLSRGDGSLQEPTLERMKHMAGLAGLDSCDVQARAPVISERAWWHYQNEQWQQAAEDWELAWQLDSSRQDYLLNWAEALLRQRAGRGDVARPIAERLKPESIDGDQRSRAAFLRWVATRHRDDGNALYRLYEHAADGDQVLRSGEIDRELCVESGSDTVCRVYDILTVSKRAAERDTLRELLSGAGGE